MHQGQYENALHLAGRNVTSLDLQGLLLAECLPTVGLTVLSDAHLQIVWLLLNPLKYWISEVYEALGP